MQICFYGRKDGKFDSITEEYPGVTLPWDKKTYEQLLIRKDEIESARKWSISMVGPVSVT